MKKECGGAKAEPPARAAGPEWLPPRLGSRRRQEKESFLLPGGSFSTWGWGAEGESASPAQRALRERWGELLARIAAPRLDRELEEAVDALFPTRFLQAPEDLVRLEARRNFDWLWKEAEELKKRIFTEVERQLGQSIFPDFASLERVRLGLALEETTEPAVAERLAPLGLLAGEPPEGAAGRLISASAGELFQALAPALEAAFAKAQRLAGERRIDRVVLSGESSRIPVVRWLFSRPRPEGGFGIPPARIELDIENAKAAVAKGACLLQVLRETTVGFEVDIADLKTHSLADLFYLEVDGARRVLFSSGPIDDLAYFEARSEIGDFPKYLSIFAGSESRLLGQFLFGEPGEELPPVAAKAGKGPLDKASQEPALPAREELLKLRHADRAQYARWLNQLLKWPEPRRLAWLEATAPPGSPQQPAYRFYLTQGQGLFAVRDAGKTGKRLYQLQPGEAGAPGIDPWADPFSGMH